jgi:recombination protein RecT
MSTEIKKVSMGNFLNFPNTQKFLETNLKENKREFVSNLLALCDADQNLAECEPGKLMLCAMNATALNLPLNKNLGYAYIIPYKGVPSFQIGYKGLIQLALRTGQYEILNATDIRPGEIERNKVTGEITFLKDNPTGAIVGYLAFLKLKTGFSASLYMTEAQIEAHAKRFSSSYRYDLANNKRTSKWSDPEARPKMSIKTVLKALLGTYGILSPEIIQAMETDNDEGGDQKEGNRNFSEAQIVPQTEPNEKAEQSEPEKIKI